MKIQIVSLATAVDRRERIGEAMRTCRWPWAFFDACTGEPGFGPAYDPARALVGRGRKLLKGEIGCFQSHWALWKALVASDDRWWIILEDDHVLDPTFDPQEVVEVAEILDIHYVRLASMYLQDFSDLGMFRGRQLVRFRSGPYGSGAYLLSREGAQRLLAAVGSIDRPIDDELDAFWTHGIPAIAVYPQPALNTGMRSSHISPHGTRLNDLRSWRDRLAWFFTRVRRKAGKTIGNLALVPFDMRCRRIAKHHR